eukprot:2351605-Rhodomonas_salina.1
MTVEWKGCHLETSGSTRGAVLKKEDNETVELRDLQAEPLVVRRHTSGDNLKDSDQWHWQLTAVTKSTSRIYHISSGAFAASGSQHWQPGHQPLPDTEFAARHDCNSGEYTLQPARWQHANFRTRS